MRTPLLLLMALISTVESLTTYYVQLAVFGLVTLVGMSVGIGYATGGSWAPKIARYLAWIICIYFIGSWVLIIAFVAFHYIGQAL